MKASVLFVGPWMTAAVLIFALVDHNTYLVDRDGNVRLKDHATMGEKVTQSVLIAGIYSLVNLLCVYGSQSVLVYIGRRQ